MVRKLSRIALCLALANLWIWAPALPPVPGVTVAQVRAQSVFPIMGPGGTLVYSNASVTAVNTSSEVSMFQYLIPAAYVATASSTGASFSYVFTGGTPNGTSTTGGGVTPVGALSAVPQPLHFRAIGLIAAGNLSTLNIGVNLNDGIAPPSSGAGTATLTLNNLNFTSSTALTPVRLDVYIVPIATGTATPNNPNNALMWARFEVGNSASSATITETNVIAGVNFASPTRLNVVARWAAASNASSLTFYSRVLRLME